MFHIMYSTEPGFGNHKLYESWMVKHPKGGAVVIDREIVATFLVGSFITRLCVFAACDVLWNQPCLIKQAMHECPLILHRIRESPTLKSPRVVTRGVQSPLRSSGSPLS
jgi:hypothetical protein